MNVATLRRQTSPAAPRGITMTQPQRVKLQQSKILIGRVRGAAYAAVIEGEIPTG